MIESGLQFMDGVFEVRSGTELLDKLKRRSHRIERGDFQNLGIVQAGDDAFILILSEQRFEHRAGLAGRTG